MKLHPEAPIDVLLLCGARPELIKETLRSFNEKVFGNFNINNVFANIDPFQGGPDAVFQVELAIRTYFPNANVRRPSQCSFTDAVRWLWANFKSDIALHLEDDWRAKQKITSDMVLPHFSDTVRQVSIVTKEKNWISNWEYHVKWRRRRILGVKCGRKLLKDEPVFTTSPSFIERKFANSCASKFDESLDPEKQLYNGSNPELQTFTRRYQNRLIGLGRAPLIEDIGRAYREQTKMSKEFIAGQSIWREIQ